MQTSQKTNVPQLYTVKENPYDHFAEIYNIKSKLELLIFPMRHCPEEVDEDVLTGMACIADEVKDSISKIEKSCVFVEEELYRINELFPCLTVPGQLMFEYLRNLDKDGSLQEKLFQHMQQLHEEKTQEIRNKQDEEVAQ